MEILNLKVDKSPYLVRQSLDVIELINIYSRYHGSAVLEDYQDYYRLDFIKMLCDFNKQYYDIPIKYQNIHFFLHKEILERSQRSGRKFCSSFHFPSCYINLDSDLRDVVIRTKLRYKWSLRELTKICSSFRSEIRLSKKSIPLEIIIKCCDLLELPLWDLLSGKVMYGKTYGKRHITIPSKSSDYKLDTILIWLLTEGHMELSSSHIEINQMNDIESLVKLKELFKDVFQIEDDFFSFSKGVRGENRMIISSSPLRQYICLKYNILPGYKSGSIGEIVRNYDFLFNLKSSIAAYVQTEGCLSYSYTRNKKKKLPKFEFLVKDKSLTDDCYNLLKYFNFNPRYYKKQNIFKVGLYNHQEVIRLIKLIDNHLLSHKKVNNLRKICTNGIGL